MTTKNDEKIKEFSKLVKTETNNNLAKILRKAVNQLFQAELESYLNSKKYERNDDRVNYRSGTRCPVLK